ncbi:MAG: hypothetical protein EXR98_14870 [Gemmataceae bacterium]|nr:hypothetical protein [Gemmataceae bacterium]
MTTFLAMTLVTMAQLSIVKAYVVPTGSMAPTILGFHKDVTCPQCKSRLSINASMEMDSPFRVPEKITGCTCTNCRFPIDFAKEKMTPRPLGGDRILAVAASPKSVQRGDVMVHRHPPSWFREKREELNYVSRVLGLPGETLAIHAGRIYSSTDLKHKDGKVKPEELWQHPHMHVDDDEAIRRFQQGKFQIVRKSPAMLLAMRRIVYDHDFPAYRPDLAPRWAGAKNTAWRRDEPHGFQYDGKGAGVDWLSYRHLLRPNGIGKARPHLIMDDLAYNTYTTANRRFDQEPNWVGDLLLQCQVSVSKPEGELWLDLARGSDRFQARCKLDSGRCTLYRLSKNGKPKKLASIMKTALNKVGTFLIRFANCDDRLTLWIDDQLPFGDGVPYDASPQNGPTLDDLDPVRIGSDKARIRVHQLQLWRNIYYTQRGGSPDVDRVDGADPKTWDPLRKPPTTTFYVQPGHYFFLSDNPPWSSDSRDWGVVPAGLLAGKVVLRYFPFERTGSIR